MDRERRRGTPLAVGTILGAVIGFAGIGTAVTVLGLVFDLSIGMALGMGAFVGTWSGCGFGAMLGATIASFREDSHTAQLPRPHAVPAGEQRPADGEPDDVRQAS